MTTHELILTMTAALTLAACAAHHPDTTCSSDDGGVGCDTESEPATAVACEGEGEGEGEPDAGCSERAHTTREVRLSRKQPPQVSADGNRVRAPGEP